MTLAEQIERILRERGPLPCSEISSALRRRNADVLAALRADPRFARVQGRTRRSRWWLAEAVGRNRRALRTATLAGRLELSAEAVERLLAESEAMGVVERVGLDRWRLSAWAEAAFGAALRGLAPYGEEAA